VFYSVLIHILQANTKSKHLETAKEPVQEVGKSKSKILLLN
jgi:hypothetical protein